MGTGTDVARVLVVTNSLRLRRFRSRAAGRAGAGSADAPLAGDVPVDARIAA